MDYIHLSDMRELNRKILSIYWYMVLTYFLATGLNVILTSKNKLLYFKNGIEKQIELKSKKALAKDIVDAITELL